nr:tudor domain-containing protein 1 isoform X1 [Parasteatoda tepidariorum]
MSENGRTVLRSRLYPPRPSSDFTTGLVAFKFAKDAAEVMHRMNKKPPLNMEMTYAHKKKHSRIRGDNQSDSSSGSHSRMPPQSSVSDEVPSLGNKGRGSFLSNALKFSKSPVDLQNDSSSFDSHSKKKPLSTTSDPVPSLGGKGRGNLFSNDSKFPRLRVVLDGQKRSSEIISLPPSDLPQLVENPFLKCLCCDNVGKFSCATCKGPYCSSKCQVEDWPKHKLSCNSSHKRSRDSSYVSESSGSDSEKKSLPSKFAVPKTVNKQPVLQVVKVKDIKTEALPKDKHIKVNVSHFINPSKLWIQPSTAPDRLSQMERDLALFVKQTPSSYDLSHVYCVNQRGSCKRVAVLEVNGDKTASVQFLDYGNTATVQINQLFLLPNTFKEIPYQAIQCKLGDIGEEKDIAWSEDDTEYFQKQFANKSYSARALKVLGNDTYVVNLSYDGLSLYSILSVLNPNLSTVEVKESAVDSAGSKQPSIPSVWSSLKNGDKVAILGLEFSENQFWGILDNGSGAQKSIEELDRIFKSLDTKDCSLCAEEGDVVAGLSLKFNEFYRCVVLKRMRDKFLVHFIDYGNEEEISKLCELTPELWSKCCYVVCCSKPNSISQEEFKSVFTKTVSVCVNKSDDNSTKLSFLHKNCEIYLDCFPWYHVIGQAKPTKLPEKRIKSDLVADMPFDDSIKYQVKVVFIGGGASKIFIQLLENESKLEALMKQLYKHCSSNISDKYTPIKNEIVCCKFKEDGNWYRGEVIGKKGKKYKVFFVDFGNEDWVVEEEMRALPTNLSLHKLVICTSLPIVNDEDLKELIPKLTSECWEMKIIDKSSSPVKIMLYQNEKPVTDFLKKKFVPTKASLSQQKLPEGKKCEVMVFHTEKNVVYVQQIEDAQQIRDLDNNMNSAVAAMPPAKEILINNVYCALFTDGLWYRASIDKDLQNNQYLATFIDFGNQEIVDVQNLKDLSEEFFKFPIFGISVIPQNVSVSQMQAQVKYQVEVIEESPGAQLVKILNVGRSDDSIQTSEVSSRVKISSLEKQLIPLNKTVEVSLCYIEEEIYYCWLVCEQERIKSLEAKLLSAAAFESLSKLPDVGCVVCAKFTDDIWYRGSVEEVCPSSSSCKICFIDYGNTETISIENMRILPSEINSFPIFSIPVRFSNPEKLQKLVENGATTFHVQAVELSDEGIQLVKIVELEDKKPIFTSIPTQLLSDLPTEVAVCYKESDLYYVQKVSDEDSLKEMMTSLQNPENLDAVQHSPKVGEVICAKSKDGLWYRGIIKKDCGNDLLKVFFVDYGSTEEVNKKHVCYLLPIYASLPMLSIPIKLSDLNKYTTCLSIDSRYTVKCIGTASDNIQIVKVRPSVKFVPISSIKSCTLEENLTLVNCHNSCEKYYFLIKNSDIDRMNEMNRLLKEFKGEEIFDAPVVDEIVIVKGADKNWSRGCIQVTNVRPGFCRVLFVDKGTSEDVPYSDVCYMSEQFNSFPLFNIKVLINSDTQFQIGKEYVVQVESKIDNVPLVRVVTQYTLHSLEKLYLPMQTPIKVRFCHCDRDVFFVQVVDQFPLLKELSQEVQTCSLGIIHKPKVGELLVARCSLDNIQYRCSVEEVISSDMFKVIFIDYGNSEVVSKEKMQYFSDKLFKYPPLCRGVKIPNLTAAIELEQEYTVLAKNLPESNEPQVVELILETVQQIQPLCKEINVSAQKFNYGDMKPVPFPIGEQDIIIHTVVSPQIVFCAPFSEANLTALTDLFQEITKYCNELTDISSYEGDPPVEGEIVLAKYEDAWYRALIVNDYAPNYEVLYVDFGNSEEISIKDMRRMTNAFMSLEVQTHPCLLTGYNYEETDSNRIEEEIKKFTMQCLSGIATKVGEDMQVEISLITEHLKERNLITS